MESYLVLSKATLKIILVTSIANMARSIYGVTNLAKVKIDIRRKKKIQMLIFREKWTFRPLQL